MPPLVTVPILAPQHKMRADRLAGRLQHSTRMWVLQQGRAEARAQLFDEKRLRQGIAHRFHGQVAKLGSNVDGADIDALVVLVLMEATKAAEEDLRATMAQMSRANTQKRSIRQSASAMKNSRPAEVVGVSRISSPSLQIATRATALRQGPRSDLDSLSEMGEMESLRLQMMMDRLSRFISTLSNLMKKMSSTSDSIIQNIK